MEQLVPFAMSAAFKRWTRAREDLAAAERKRERAERAFAEAKRFLDCKTRVRDDLAQKEFQAYIAVPESERLAGFDTLPANVLDRISEFACADATSRTAIKSVCVSWNRDMPDRVFQIKLPEVTDGYHRKIHGRTLVIAPKRKPHQCDVFNLATKVCTRFNTDAFIVPNSDTMVTFSDDGGIEWRSMARAHPTIAISGSRLQDLLNTRPKLYHDGGVAVGIATWRASRDEFLIVNAVTDCLVVLPVNVDSVVHVSSALIVVKLVEDRKFHVYSLEEGTLVATVSKFLTFVCALPDGGVAFLASHKKCVITVSPTGKVGSRACDFDELGNDDLDFQCSFTLGPFSARMSPNRRFFAYCRRERNDHFTCTVRRTLDFKQVAAYSFASPFKASVDDEGRVFAIPLARLAFVDEAGSHGDTMCNVFSFPRIG